MSDPGQAPSRAHPIEVLVTANEAYPRLEHLFLSARTSIQMGLRLFDPQTRLLSDSARAVGSTWADLILHTLERGVAIDLTLSDFDPVMGHDLHVQAWRFVRRCLAINEMKSEGAANFTVRCLLHPAEGGVPLRLLFAYSTRKELHSIVRKMNASDSPARSLAHAPGLWDRLKLHEGRVVTRAFSLPRVFPGTLHHKVAVIDGALTYIGGLDLNNRRLDDTHHKRPASETWHDVQVLLHDPDIAHDAADFLTAMPHMIAGRLYPAPTQSSFVRTLSRRRRHNRFSLAPKTLTDEILEAHLSQIDKAKTLIYLESQYFRDRRIAKALAAAARRTPRLQVMLMLPAAPDDVAFSAQVGLDAKFGEYLQARAIRKVRRAFGDRFFVFSPAQPRPVEPDDHEEGRAILDGAPIVYVHSKISLFDDDLAIVSSANLNGRSLRWDSEAGVTLRDPESIEHLRCGVFRYWLGDETERAFFTPETAFDAWKIRALENRAKMPADRIGFVLPHAVQPARDLGVPIPGAPEALV